jgi:hypothetical protein
MAFILVFSLLISKAYSFDDCQIVVLHVQGKASQGMAALRGAHGSRHDFFIFYRTFCLAGSIRVAFLRPLVVFCKCIMDRRVAGGRGKPLADVPFSC